MSFGDPDGEDFAFTKCDADGTFTLTGLPDGNWRITIFDQWNDQLVDGLSTPVRLGGRTVPGSVELDVQYGRHRRHPVADEPLYANLHRRQQGRHLAEPARPGFRSPTSRSGCATAASRTCCVTDFTGTANFNETFPLFNWYVVETDITRYKNTGTHVVYDVGRAGRRFAACGAAGLPAVRNLHDWQVPGQHLEQISLPANLRVPGAVYCADADCTGQVDR